jgi:hypothetical protein
MVHIILCFLGKSFSSAGPKLGARILFCVAEELDFSEI